MFVFIRLTSIFKSKLKGAGGVAQLETSCLACIEPCVQTPALDMAFYPRT